MKFNIFCTYELSDDEKTVGSCYNHLQLAVLQNRRAEIAQSILNIKYDPSEPLKFVQEQSYLAGQLAIINWQIDLAAHSQGEMQELEKNRPMPDAGSSNAQPNS